MPQTLAPENRAVSSAQQCSTSPAIQVQITLDWRRSAASGISPQGQPSVIKPRKKENNPFTAHSLKRSTEQREHWLPWKDCTAFLCTSSERSAEMIPCSIIIQICLPSAFTQCGTPSSHESSVLPGEKYSDGVWVCYIKQILSEQAVNVFLMHWQGGDTMRCLSLSSWKFRILIYRFYNL